MTSKTRTFFLILVWVCFSQCHAQAGALRQYRLQRQRQEVQPMPYAAAGYRPGRQFVLPQEQEQEQQPQPQNEDESDFVNERRPELTYGAPRVQAPTEPARLIQARQQFFLAPVSAPAAATRSKSARLTASAPKSARLAINSEDVPEDAEDEFASDIEVDVKTESVPRVTNPQASTVYYPAGAVSFVQPFPGAGSYVQTAQAPATAIAQTPTAAYVQPLQQYSNFQVQPIAAAAPATAAKLKAKPVAAIAGSPAPFFASPAAYTASPSFFSSPSANAFAQPGLAKLQVQPVTAAKLEAQPIAAAPVPSASFFASPAAYTAAPSFFSAPANLQVQPIASAKLEAQPVAAAPVPSASFFASPAAYTASPSFFSAPANLQVQSIASAKLEAQPIAAAPVPSASFYASPAAYTASPSFFSAPASSATAAYTAPLAQQQLYISAPTMAAAQLQAW